jgi:hypothetical protein
MVPSSLITITADSECLTYGGFSLSETIHLWNFEFIVDYLGCQNPSRSWGDSGIAFMGSTHNGTPSPWRTMIEDGPKSSS